MNSQEQENAPPQINGIDFIRLRLENVPGEGDQLDRLPMGLMMPHEAQCKENHEQTLKRVAERGGLDSIEALAIIEGWDPFSNTERETKDSAYSKLTTIVAAWEGLQTIVARWRDRANSHSRRFILVRKEDETGISGTGIVAHGVQWLNGEMVLHWPSRGGTTAFYKSADQLEAIHGHGGKTVIEWID